MSGLLLKDFYTLIKQMKVFIAMIVIFSLLPNFSMTGFAIIYAAMLPITAMAYDERSKWHQLAAMMPYSVRDLVLSKYLLGYGTVGATFVMVLIARLILGAIKGQPAGGAELMTIFITANAALIIEAVNLPLMFRFGVEKGRMLLLVLVAMLVMAAMASVSLLSTLVDQAPAGMLRIAALSAAATVAVNILSIRIAFGLYGKRLD